MYERMLNKQEKPSYENLCLYCKSMSEFFQNLNFFLSDNLKTTKEIRFPYGNKYGWSVSHRKDKKLICDIFAEVDSFTVMLRLSNQQYDEVYKELHEYTKHLIDNKYPCSDGGWIHYRILTKEHLEDVQKLLTIKCN